MCVCVWRLLINGAFVNRWNNLEDLSSGCLLCHLINELCYFAIWSEDITLSALFTQLFKLFKVPLDMIKHFIYKSKWTDCLIFSLFPTASWFQFPLLCRVLFLICTLSLPPLSTWLAFDKSLAQYLRVEKTSLTTATIISLVPVCLQLPYMAVPQMVPVNPPQQPLMVNSPINALLFQVTLWVKCNTNTVTTTYLRVYFHRALQVV